MHTHSPQSWLSFKSLRNRYHNLILLAKTKKKFHSTIVSSSSTNPRRRLWQTVNKLLHRKSTSPLPTFSSSIPLPDRFASFFTDKISTLHLSLSFFSSHHGISALYCYKITFLLMICLFWNQNERSINIIPCCNVFLFCYNDTKTLFCYSTIQYHSIRGMGVS